MSEVPGVSGYVRFIWRHNAGTALLSRRKGTRCRSVECVWADIGPKLEH